MREIKFRGKRIDNGEWVYGYLIKNHYHNTWMIRPCSDILNIKGISYAIDPETVGQYTGLKDKNGKEIYEGDVVDSWADLDKSYFREVVWNGCGLEFKPLTGFTLCKANESHFSIIGNIHDNSELLNQQS